jgi:hypothetical protein
MNMRLKRPRSARLAVAAAAAMLAGCGPSPTATPVEQFARKHGDEARRYVFISPLRLDVLDWLNDEKAGELVGIAQSLRDQFKDKPEVVAFADKLFEMRGRGDRRWKEIARGLREAEAAGGTVCQYEWRDGSVVRRGLLVLRSGDVVKDLLWVEENLRE